MSRSKTGLSIQLGVVALLLMLVAACSKPVATEWIPVKDATPTDRFVTYAAPSTLRTDGHTAKMWSLIDAPVSQEAVADRPRFSWIDEWEYDCQRKMLRPLYCREYAGKMGSGENVYSQADPASPWMAVNPGSVGETLWKMACGKK